MLHRRHVEHPRLFDFVGFDASHIMQIFRIQVVDEGTQGDLELGGGRCWPPSGCSPWIALREKDLEETVIAFKHGLGQIPVQRVPVLGDELLAVVSHRSSMVSYSATLSVRNNFKITLP